jgi:hypothetical protein
VPKPPAPLLASSPFCFLPQSLCPAECDLIARIIIRREWQRRNLITVNPRLVVRLMNCTTSSGGTTGPRDGPPRGQKSLASNARIWVRKFCEKSMGIYRSSSRIALRKTPPKGKAKGLSDIARRTEADILVAYGPFSARDDAEALDVWDRQRSLSLGFCVGL